MMLAKTICLAYNLTLAKTALWSSETESYSGTCLSHHNRLTGSIVWLVSLRSNIRYESDLTLGCWIHWTDQAYLWLRHTIEATRFRSWACVWSTLPRYCRRGTCTGRALNSPVPGTSSSRRCVFVASPALSHKMNVPNCNTAAVLSLVYAVTPVWLALNWPCANSSDRVFPAGAKVVWHSASVLLLTLEILEDWFVLILKIKNSY